MHDFLNWKIDLSRRSVVLAGAVAVVGCAQPNDPLKAGTPNAALNLNLKDNETLVALRAQFAKPSGYASLRFYYAGPLSAAKPETSIGPSTLQFSLIVPTGKMTDGTAPLIFKVKTGWFRLGGMSDGNRNALLSFYARLVPNAINYVGDVSVDAGLYSVDTKVTGNRQTVERLQSNFPELFSKFQLVQRMLA